MERVRITNGLGQQRIILKKYLQKVENDFAYFKEIILPEEALTDSRRQYLEKLWTIVKVEDVES